MSISVLFSAERSSFNNKECLFQNNIQNIWYRVAYNPYINQIKQSEICVMNVLLLVLTLVSQSKVRKRKKNSFIRNYGEIWQPFH